MCLGVFASHPLCLEVFPVFLSHDVDGVCGFGVFAPCYLILFCLVDVCARCCCWCFCPVMLLVFVPEGVVGVCARCCCWCLYPVVLLVVFVSGVVVDVCV